MHSKTRVIICGRAGSGKDFLKTHFKTYFKTDVSLTTRNPRIGEVDGVDYKFVTKDYFCQMIMNESLFEYEIFGENYYGTEMESWEKSQVFIMTPTAIKKMKHKSTTFVIFLNIDLSVLGQRLQKRNLTQQQIETRFKLDDNEFEGFTDFNLVITNPLFNPNSIVQILKDI